jgi:hypothetical protein
VYADFVAIQELDVYASGLLPLLNVDDPDALRGAVRPLPIDPLVTDIHTLIIVVCSVGRHHSPD